MAVVVEISDAKHCRILAYGSECYFVYVTVYTEG